MIYLNMISTAVILEKDLYILIILKQCAWGPCPDEHTNTHPITNRHWDHDKLSKEVKTKYNTEKLACK